MESSNLRGAVAVAVEIFNRTPVAVFGFPDSGTPLRFLRPRPPSVVAVEIFNRTRVAVLQTLGYGCGFYDRNRHVWLLLRFSIALLLRFSSLIFINMIGKAALL